MSLIGSAKRDAHLETLRGLAALSVLFWHTSLGFFPVLSGIFPGFSLEQSLRGSLAYGFFNGTAAVGFFFVLSGYVLTRSFFQSGNSVVLYKNAIKRWPRLAAPVGVVVVLSWAAIEMGFYHFTSVARMTGSPWLFTFGYASREPFDPDFLGALSQGFVTTFFRGDATYDSSIWSMKFEMIGSFISFALAMMLAIAPNLALRLYISAVVIVAASFAKQYWYIAFVGGVMLAATLPRKPVQIPAWLSAIGIAFAMYLAGYSDTDIGVFHPLYLVAGQLPEITVWTLGSLILILAISLNDSIRTAFSGRVGRFLGWISFPLYLIHVPLICSFGCSAFLVARDQLGQDLAPAVAAIAVISMAILAAIPLALASDWWLRLLNRVTELAVPPPTRMSS